MSIEITGNSASPFGERIALCPAMSSSVIQGAFRNAPVPLGYCGAWDNDRMSASGIGLVPRRVQALSIAVLVVLLAVFTWITPPHAAVLHNILHHLNILPFMLAGLLFGWRGALQALLLAAVLQSPSIHRHWHHDTLDAQDQIVELSIFGAAGVIAGVVADRERTQRKRAEATRLELQTMHTELQQNIEHLRKTERLTAAGRLAASLAHEIRNPLASISGAAGILTRGVAPAESQAECLEVLSHESQRLNKLLTNFLDFARPRLPRLQWLEAGTLLESVATLALHARAERKVNIRRGTVLRNLEVHWDSEQITQVLLNLFLNAIEASEPDGEIVFSSAVRDDRIILEVLDHGKGISPSDLDCIFDPFFTTRRDGTGLGLAIAANIVNQHGGQLTCESAGRGLGSTFHIELPRDPESLVSRPAQIAGVEAQ